METEHKIDKKQIKFIKKCEDIVPDLETCKKLYEAGFNSETVFIYILFPDSTVGLYRKIHFYRDCDFYEGTMYPAPTLQELLSKVNLIPDELSTVQELAEYCIRVYKCDNGNCLWKMEAK